MMVPSEMLALKWNNHPSTFLGVLSELLDKASYCDATVACQGRLYSVHRFVLSACSEYFKDIFAAVGDRHAVIVLKDVTFEVFTDLLKYMYQGEINIEQEKLAKLISAAEYLKIKGLAEPQDEEHGGERDGVIDIDCVSSSSTGGRRASSERRGGSAVKPSGNRGKGYYGDKRKFIKGYEVSESGSCKRKRNDSTPLSSKSQSYMSDDSSGTPEVLSDPVKRSVMEMFVKGGPSSHAKGALKTNTKPVVASATECDVKSVNESEKENYFAHDPGVKTEPEEVFVLEDTSSNCEYDGVDDTAFPSSAAEGRDGKGRVTPPAAGDDRLQPDRDQDSFGTADVEMLDDYSDTAPERYNDDDFEVREEEVQLRFPPPFSTDAEPLSRNLQQLWQLSKTNFQNSLLARQLSPADIGKLSSEDFKPIIRSSGSTSSRDLNSNSGSSGSTSSVVLNTIPGLIAADSDDPNSACPSLSFMTSGEQALDVEQRHGGNFSDSVNSKTTASTTRSGKSPDRGRKSLVPYADRAFPCPHCPYRATLKGNLKKHLLKHTGEKPFSCPACDFTTAFHQSLTRHMWSVHSTLQSERDPAALGGFEGSAGPENTEPGPDSSNAWNSLGSGNQRNDSEDDDAMGKESAVSSNYVDASDYLLLEL